MSHSEPPLKSSLSLDDTVSSISSSKPSSDTSLASCFPDNSPPNHVHLPQSLLTSILVHCLNHFLESSLEWKRAEPRRVFINIKKALPTFYNNFGFVSQHFLESSHRTVKVFLESNTFHILPYDLAELSFFASCWGATVKSVFLHTYGTFNADELLDYAPIISGLEIKFHNLSDFEFLNQSSLLFPHLKELQVVVAESISMKFIELLKVNKTVTSIDFGENSIGVEGAEALADVLKVNTTVSGVHLWRNSIGAEGAKALANALKVNKTVTTLNMNDNSIDDEGAKALAEALKVNATVTNVGLAWNSIGAEGASYLSETLKVNTTVKKVGLEWNFVGADGARVLASALKVNSTVTSLNLLANAVGDNGAKDLAEVLKINTTLTTIHLGRNHIEDEGARALEELLKLNSKITIEGLDRLDI
ncbi:hypothetical protein GEMRC1_004958 [Eukaryota sp. GEM-RC1]